MNKPFKLSELRFLGANLHRPECVLCTHNGAVYASDWRGGVVQLYADGQQRFFLPTSNPDEVKTNGFALCQDGSFLIANLGDAGGVWRLNRCGDLRPFLMDIENTPIPPANFVLIDRLERIWISVSTRLQPRQLAYKKDISDGFIIIIDDKGPRIVVDNIGYTNEIQVSNDGQWLYVNETFGRNLSRFPILKNNTLGNKEVITHFNDGVFPDGLCFDTEDNAWITSIISNRIIKVRADGSQVTLLDDSVRSNILRAEAAFGINALGREHLDNIKIGLLKNISSLAFGGKNRSTAYIGSLLDDKIIFFETNCIGTKPSHWNVNL